MYLFRTLQIAGVMALGLSAPASAVNVAFASFIPAGTGSNVHYQKIGVDNGNFFSISSPGSIVPGPTNVKFSFLDSVLAPLGVLDASFSMFASTIDNPSLSIGGLLIQSIDSGTLAFTYSGTTPLVVGSDIYTTGANLLTATYTQGLIFGTAAGSAGSAIASTPIGTVVYTSDFLDFTASSAKDFALALTAITPLLNRVNPDSSIASFSGVAAGVFSNEAPIPEPSVWAMLIAGYAMVGASLRNRIRVRRRQPVSVNS